MGYSVQPEAYLSDLKQRPDVLVKRQGRNDLALEYQCAPITPKRLVERSNGYRSIDERYGEIYSLECFAWFLFAFFRSDQRENRD